MVDVVLMGDLAQYGERHSFVAYSIRDVISAMCTQFRGFRKRLSTGDFHVRYRSKNAEHELDKTTLGMRIPNDCEVIIIPAAQGCKNGSGKIIAGLSILAIAMMPTAGLLAAGAEMGAASAVLGAEVAFGVTLGQVAGFGAMMALTGIYQAFVKSPNVSTSASAPANASFVFNGIKNTTQQGVTRPLVFGRFKCGSVIISSDLTTERVL